jgi:selenocysteine lyase/cysteine desulfurase
VLGAEPTLLETIAPDKLLPSTNVVPERFEFGTLPYETMAGATAAVDFIASLAPAGGSRRDRLIAAQQSIDEHELRLRQRIEAAVASWGDRASLHSVAEDRTPTLFVTFPGRASTHAARYLATRNILAPAGSFYAYEPFAALGLPDAGGLRVGLAAYTNDDDVDRLLDALASWLQLA